MKQLHYFSLNLCSLNFQQISPNEFIQKIIRLKENLSDLKKDFLFNSQENKYRFQLNFLINKFYFSLY